MRFPHFTVQIKLLWLEAGREDRCLLILRHFSGQCCQFHELEGTVHSLLDAWLSLRTAGTLPEYIKHFFLFLFSSASPFFCVLFSSFGWFSGYFPSAGIVPPTSALTLPSLLSHESRAPLSQRCNCSWQSKSFSGPVRSHTAMLQMPAQMPAESRTPFHLSRLKDFFVGESSWILSWDKSVFWPICFAFLSHSFWRENKVDISAEKLLVSRGKLRHYLGLEMGSFLQSGGLSHPWDYLRGLIYSDFICTLQVTHGVTQKIIGFKNKRVFFFQICEFELGFKYFKFVFCEPPWISQL